ncbi:MAG: hypothetical protein AVDCRST_MAG76-3683, partial [uncultured Acidimicrobiales bacterium]
AQPVRQRRFDRAGRALRPDHLRDAGMQHRPRCATPAILA